MRTVTRFTSPFAPLHLAAEDEVQLEQVANFFVRKAVAEYDRLLLRDERVVDTDEWRLLKHKEDVRVYLQRREKDVGRRRARAMKRFQSDSSAVKRLSSCIFAGVGGIFAGRSGDSTCETDSRPSSSAATGAGSLSSLDSSPSADSVALVPPSEEMPVLLAVGSVPGTLEDAMYGSVAASVEAMRTRSMYTRDHVMDGAVLATVVSPSASDPFRSLSIKWTQQEFPLHVRSVIKHRDLVFLESTGTTTIASGETVGFHLLHSVHFPQTHGLPGVVRGNISRCTLFRQRQRRCPDGDCRPDSVDVFAKCCLSPSEGFTRAVVVHSAAQEMAAPDAVIRCARMKKLSWIALHHHAPSTLDSLLGRKTAGGRSRRTLGDDSCCATCKRRTALGLRRLGVALGERERCKLCCRPVCSACKIKKRLVCVPLESELLAQQDVALCSVCVHSSMVRASALEVARDEVIAHAQLRQRCAQVTGRRRSRGQTPRPESTAEVPGSGTSCAATHALASVPRGVISSSVLLDATSEFYGEPHVDCW